jgi:hypothetical protein
MARPNIALDAYRLCAVQPVASSLANSVFTLLHPRLHYCRRLPPKKNQSTVYPHHRRIRNLGKGVRDTPLGAGVVFCVQEPQISIRIGIETV